MEKLKMQTPNKITENVDKIADLFPNCVTEAIGADGKPTRKVDFDLLRQELSDVMVEGGEERYQFTWADKKKSILLANSPISKTLRPCREESVDFDTTKNLYIEGDNLDVLKLLQETYMGKVKMIYIDPPYNTGSDFVYEDDFSISAVEYFERSGEKDDEGNRLLQNNDTNGRFHTDWLNMIYPRLKLSRDLLTDDGVIFISIDDNEVHNLRKVCDETFGAKNFVSELVWRKKTGAADAKGFSNISEYIVVYVKNSNYIDATFTKDVNAHDVNRYRLSDEYESRRGKHYIDNLDRGGISYSDALNYPITCPDGNLTYPNGRKEFTREGWTWTWGKEKLKWGIENGFIEFRKSTYKDSGWAVCYKNYLNVNNKDELVQRSAPHKSMIMDILNTSATLEIKELFNVKVFEYTKPTQLLKTLIGYTRLSKYDIALDFFSGSATTAHAIMQLNAEDGGERNFIIAQLPEETPEDSEARKAGYKTICEIGKERIRRAGRKIADENRLIAPNLDIGFRVLKVDTSNMKPVFYNPEAIEQSLMAHLEDNIKDDRTPEDLLFQVMLDMGIDLSSTITVETLGGKKVFTVGGDNLICCFDKDVTKDTVTAIAKRKPLYAVFRDSSFGRDDVMVSFDQIFETYSPTTTRRVI